MRLKSSREYREAATSSWLERDRSAYVGGLLSGSSVVIVLRLEQRIRVRDLDRMPVEPAGLGVMVRDAGLQIAHCYGKPLEQPFSQRRTRSLVPIRDG